MVIGLSKEVKLVEGVGEISLYPDEVVEGGWILGSPVDDVVYSNYAEAKKDFDLIECRFSLKKLFGY